jgi:hypothetical protein
MKIHPDFTNHGCNFLEFAGYTDDMAAPHSERRKKKRQSRRRSAWISYGEKPTVMLCVLWDLSDTGAKIAPTHIDILPDVFTLYLTSDGSERQFCRVAWREGRYLGVQFIDEATAEVLSNSTARTHSMRSAYSPFRQRA